jgi:cell division septum initiation protein DivIVA
MYPFIDGEIHSFVGDFIDQQRYTNRLITMYDWIINSSSKGVLMFPEDLKPDNMSMDEIAEQWTRFDGVIMYSPKPGVPMPQQIASNSTNIGISELLNLQLKLFEDISGVSGALQGKPGFSGMSASLYAQQTQNSTTSLLDLLDSFSDFEVECATKDVKNIQKFYDAKRVFNIVGKKAVTVYDPDKIANIEFDLSIIESTATPVYRQLANDMLMQLWQAHAISVEQLLENGDFPFADRLLQSIKAEQEKMEQGQQGALPPEVIAQAQHGADMNAVNKAYGMLR